MNVQQIVIIRRFQAATGCATLVELAKYLEVHPSRINEVIRRGKIPDTWLYKIAYRTRRNEDWLKTGAGPEFIDGAAAEAAAEFGRTAAAREVIEAMEHMDEEEQQATRQFLNILKVGDMKVRRHIIGQVALLDDLAATKRRMKPTRRESREVPILSLVAAGKWRPAQDPYPVGAGQEYIETDLPGKNLYALRIEGQSMAPLYKDGEVIFVDPDQNVGQRDLGIFKRVENQEACFKQLVLAMGGRKKLRSFNPDKAAYPDIELQPGDIAKGRVVAPIRTAKR